MRSPSLVVALLLLVGAGVSGAGGSAHATTQPRVAATARAAAIPLPHNDAFYRYTGTTPLGSIKAGTVLKKRAVTLGLFGEGSTPLPAEQVQYRTQNQLGKPAIGVTTVVNPTGVSTGIVSYLSFYDALGDVCDPSFTLRGGYPATSSNQSQAQIEEGLVTALVGQGYAVTVPDFEGVDQHWVAGQESGWSTLDSIRATEHYLGSPASTKVGLYGYSGGSIAGEWASELTHSYSPELNVVGTAIGGIPVDLAHNYSYVNGSSDWSGVMPAVLVSLSRAFGVDSTKYESAYGRKLAKTVSDECIGSFNGSYPGLTAKKLLKKQYADLLKIPVFAKILNRLIMGSTAGTPKMPMFMGVGNVDGKGDGVMIERDVEALGHEYCSQGSPVELHVYKKSAHTEAGVQFFPAGMAFLAERFAGVPFSGSCATIPTGNSLAPLPTH